MWKQCGEASEGNLPWLLGMTNPRDIIFLMTKQGRFEILDVRTNMVIFNLQELQRGSVLIDGSGPDSLILVCSK